jgi:hypothetical protein
MRNLLAALGSVGSAIDVVRQALWESVQDWRADRRRARYHQIFATLLAQDTSEIEGWLRIAAHDLERALASMRVRGMPLSDSEAAALTSVIGVARTALAVHGPRSAAEVADGR